MADEKQEIEPYERQLVNAREIGARDGKATALGNLGKAYADMGLHDEVISRYDQALELGPCHVDNWYDKSDSLVILGRHEEAIYCFDIALELTPRLKKVWNNKGNSLAK